MRRSKLVNMRRRVHPNARIFEGKWPQKAREDTKKNKPTRCFLCLLVIFVAIAATLVVFVAVQIKQLTYRDRMSPILLAVTEQELRTLVEAFLISDREISVGLFQQFMDDPDYPATEKPEVLGVDKDRRQPIRLSKSAGLTRRCSVIG